MSGRTVSGILGIVAILCVTVGGILSVITTRSNLVGATFLVAQIALYLITVRAMEVK